MATKSLTFELFGHDRTASSAIRGVGDAGAAWERRMAGAAFGVGAALGIAAIAAGKFAADSIEAYAEAEQAQNRLNFAFEKFPALAGGNVEALRKMNTALQATTRFEDDSIAAAQGVLAQYDLNAQQLEDITPLLLDYAAATGKDVGTAAEDLGKALLGQGRALKAVGIDFQDAGDPLSNYNQLMEDLSRQVGGFAEKDAQTLSGRLDTIKNQFGDIQEVVGSAFAPAIGVASDIIEEKLLPRLDQAAQGIATNLGESLTKLAPEISDAIDEILPELDRLINYGVSDGLPLLVDSAKGDIKFFADTQDVFERTDSFFNDYLPKWAAGTVPVQESWDGFFNWWDLAWDGQADTVQNKSDEIKRYWSSTLYDMKEAVYASDMQTVGWEFAQGFADGITTNAEAAASAAEQMALRTRDRVRSAMQIQSPSKVMRDLGKYIPQGFAAGIEDEMWRVDSAFADMAPTSKSKSVAARVPSGGGGGNVYVTVQGAVGNEDFLAKTVQRAVNNSRRRGTIVGPSFG